MAKKVKITKKTKKKLFSIVGAFLIVLVGVTIAYAALSTTLSITINKITQNALTWNVAFDTTTVAGVSSRGDLTCPSVTPTGTTVEIGDITLNLPGDRCVYQLTVKNTGGIDATLSGIAKIGSDCGTISGSSFICGTTGATDPFITVKLATTNGATAAASTALTTGGTLAKTNGSQTVYLILEHNPDATTTVSSTTTYSGIGFELTYGQQ